VSDERWAGSPLELIEQLCQLQGEYADVVGYQTPRDCFCGQGGFWRPADDWPKSKEGWKNDGSAVRFIVEATRKALAEMTKP